MNGAKSNLEPRGVGGILALTFGAAIAFLFGGLAIGIVLDIFGVHIMGSSSFHLMANGIWIGALVGAVYGMSADASRTSEMNRIAEEKESRRKEQEAARKTQKNLAAEKAHQQLIATLIEKMRTACEESIVKFEMLPGDLKIAYDWLLEAQYHFKNNAYSPFWHAVENAYGSLGYFNARMAYIESLTRQYSESAHAYAAAGGKGSVPLYPMEVSTANATRASEYIVQVANDIVYAAQRDAIFSQIWEQRRTTAAVVAGFANLEQAVSGMSRTLQAVANSLVGSVDVASSEGYAKDPRVEKAVSLLAAERWRASPLS